MSELKTVKVKHGDDYKVINECDFNEDKHELYLDEAEVQAKAEQEAKADAEKKAAAAFKTKTDKTTSSKSKP